VKFPLLVPVTPFTVTATGPVHGAYRHACRYAFALHTLRSSQPTPPNVTVLLPCDEPNSLPLIVPPAMPWRPKQ